MDRDNDFVKKFDYWDTAYNSLILNVHDHGVWTDNNVRTKYADGTPATYKAIAGVCFKLDNSKDRAFLLTTKNVLWKSAIKELYWIYIMQSNNVTELENLGTNIWTPWGMPETNRNKLEYVRPRIKEMYTELPKVKVADIINPNPEKIYKSNYGDFYIVERIKNDNVVHDEHPKCKIQFLETGYIKIVSVSSIRGVPSVMDPYHRSVMGIGYMGDCRAKDISDYFGIHLERWIEIWRGIIKRCYGTNSEHLKYYKDIFVSPEFHSCEYFLRWVMISNRFGNRHLDKLYVDKDYYSSNYYGEDSCVLVTPKENSQLASEKYFRFDNQFFFSIRDLYKYINEKYKLRVHSDKTYHNKLITKIINSLISPEHLSDDDISIIPNKETHGAFPRFSLEPYETIGPSYGAAVNIPTFGYKNQLEYVVETLKKDPNSRRAMINLWIPEDLHKMALTPCCYNLIFNILDGKLHMQLNIRSSDIALGLPFNIFQFQVLHKLIAHEVGVEPADFIVMISNLHYYDRHEEKLLEQIDMPVYGDAKLRIEYPDSIWDFKPEMVHVDDYNHGPKIDFEIAI